ncbi:MAG TPA: hypothetical protein VJX29_14490 [Candidatus Acidoferrales bacterium]|nr:hypothetical protein [Candidatus Acidoferrales bacterium]
MDQSPRGKESTPLEQAVSRAMRDNLALVQHTAKELSQAIEDFVAACGSTRNANMLPSMLRAQTASASLTSMLEVLTRLLTASLQPGRMGASEAYVASLASAEAPAAEAAAPPVAAPVPVAPLRVGPQAHVAPEPAVAPPVVPPPIAVPVAPPPAPPVEPRVEAAAPAPVIEEQPEPAPEPVVEHRGGPLVPVETEPAPPHDFVPAGVVAADEAVAERVVAVQAPPAPVFRVEDLPQEQQELHRRANRHAKVSMQDIYLLRPKDVQLARQNRDICVRLRSDIEKARKEYVRRFGPILDHPVDYFYHWMVEVLAEGKPEILGEYPYPSAAARR